MTRLTEALERAGVAPAPEPPPPGTVPAAPRHDVPADWQFDTRRADPDPAVAPALLPERPTFGADTAGKLVVGDHAEGALIEQYRRLAAVLHHAQNQRQAKVVMIASAVPSEGKTLTATNLALTLSHSYQRRVLLVDADLRRPSLHTIFGIPNDAGLTTTLLGPQRDHLPVRHVYSGLWLMPAGRPDPNPMSILTSGAMKQLLSDAASQFDWVIVDTPPVGLMPDANLLAEMVDAALIVVSAGTTPYPMAKKAVEAIGMSRVLGVVLNRAEKSAAADEYEYYGYGEEPSGPRAKPARGRFARR